MIRTLAEGKRGGAHPWCAEPSRARLLPPGSGRRVLLLLPLVVFTVQTLSAQLTKDHIGLMRMVFEARFADYAQQENNDQAVWDINYQMRKFPGQGSLEERYQSLAKGVAIMVLGGWNEGHEVGAALDMRVSAILSEPGKSVEVRFQPLYERADPLEHAYQAKVELVDRAGAPQGPEKNLRFTELTPSSFQLSIPASLPTGRYAVRYELRKEGSENGEPILSGRRTLAILTDLGSRVKQLEKTNAKLEKKKSIRNNPRLRLAGETVLWYIGTYQGAMAQSFRGFPIFVNSISRWPRNLERINFAEELAFVEQLAQDLAAGGDPLKDRSGDMRLAVASTIDGNLIPFRLFVPEDLNPSRNYPMVLGLHGAGGNENAYMDFYDGLFKKNAQLRGYILATPHSRGAYRGTHGVLGKDAMDVLNVVQALYPIDVKRTYLTGHSQGGGMTIVLGFDYADRFAAVAPVAGFFGFETRLRKAKNMPLLLAHGEADRVIPVSHARAAYREAQRIEMPAVEYIELEGVDHVRIAMLTMDRVFDWFDSHVKE